MKRSVGIVAGLATAAVLGTATPALAGSTLGFNDGGQSFKVVENSVTYTLPAGKTTRGYLGLTDIDTVVVATGQCGQISIDYGPWQLLRANSTGISAGASVVHVKTFTC